MTRFGSRFASGIIQSAIKPPRQSEVSAARKKDACAQPPSMVNLISRIAVLVAVVSGLLYFLAAFELWGSLCKTWLQSVSSAALGYLMPAWTLKPWPIVGRAATRFKALHVQIKRELRSTRADLEGDVSTGRTAAELIEDRLPLAFKLKELGIQAPPHQEQQLWLEFIVLIADLSRTGRVKQAREEFAVLSAERKFESEDQFAMDPGDYEDSIETARDCADSFLAQCQNRVLSQERINREFAVKAMGIVTFAASMLVFGIDWEVWPDTFKLERLLGFAIGFCVLSIINPALSVIIRPRGLWNACDIGKIKLLALDARSGFDSVKLIRAIAASHQSAIQVNEKVLTDKAACLTFMTWTAMLAMCSFCACSNS